MPSDTQVEPPGSNPSLQTSNPGGGGKPPMNKNKRNLIIGGVAVVGLVGLYLYIKNKNASSSTTSASVPTLISPASTGDSVSGDNTDALLNALANNGAATSTGLANLQTALEQQIASLQNTTGSNGTQTTTTTTSNPAPPAPPVQQSASLPPAEPGISNPAAYGIGTPAIGSIVGSFFDAASGVADYVTNKGFVYSVGGPGNTGAYYGGTNAGAVGGAPASNIVGIQGVQGGGYELINNYGQTYNFGPNPGQYDAAIGGFVPAGK